MIKYRYIAEKLQSRPGLTLKGIAKKHRCSIHTALRAVRRADYKLRDRKPNRFNHEKHLEKRQKYSTFNWLLNDAELARQHGRSREAFRQIRKKYGFPQSPDYNRKGVSAGVNLVNL